MSRLHSSARPRSRFFQFACLASLGALSAQLGCASIIGLDAYKPDPEADSDSDGSGGSASGGSGTGGNGSGECVNDKGGTEVDQNCTAAKPFCDGGVCKECVEDAHCDDDNNCTIDACLDNVCNTTATDQLVLMDKTTANGSFEDFDDSTGDELAVGWSEEGGYIGDVKQVPLTYDCTGGCNFLGDADPETSASSEQGARIMWLGNFEGWTDLADSPLLNVPANAASLHVVITTKVYTQEVPNDTARDTYRVTLIADDGNELGIIHEGSNLEAPAVETAEFDYDAIDEDFVVPAPWQVSGQAIRLRIESTSNDTDASGDPDVSTDGTDFGFDDIRIVANLICD